MYIKVSVGDELATQDVNIDLCSDNIYAICPSCGKEFQVDPIEFAHDFPKFSWEHQPICDECSKK